MTMQQMPDYGFVVQNRLHQENEWYDLALNTVTVEPQTQGYSMGAILCCAMQMV